MTRQRWSVGDIEVNAVVEDEYRGIPPEMFFPSGSAERVRAQQWLMPTYANAAGLVGLRVQAFLLRVAAQWVLVDPCVGNGKRRSFPPWNDLSSRWLEDLRASGCDPEAVDLVVHTHLHPDHVGWDTTFHRGSWMVTFPSARHVYVREEYDHWRMHPSGDADAVFADSVEPVLASGLASFVAADAEIATGVRLIPTPGHTPGHASLEVTSGTHRAVITGDLVHHPAQLAYPGWEEIGDVDVDLARQTRRRFFERYADTDVLVLGTHFPAEPGGRIRRRGDAWYFEPVVGET